LWTLTDCTGVHGTDLVLTPSAGTIKARMQLGSWTVAPFMLPHIAHSILVNWNLTNVSQVKVYLVSIDGTSKVLLEKVAGDGFTTRNETYQMPYDTDTKYAGSYAQDYGCGVVIDTGTDDLANGISSATMSAAERAMSYMLGTGRGYRYLEFEITCTGNVTLNYPSFNCAKSGWNIVCENGHQQVLVRPNGPALRFGQLTFNSGNSLINPPALKPFPDLATILGGGPTKMSIVDWLCIKRALCGLDPTTGVTTELSSLFDSFEGQSVQNSSETCHVFLLPINSGTIRAALVNSFSEPPPLALFPKKDRNTTDWSYSGSYCLEAWEWAQDPRYILSNPQIDLYNGATKWTSLSSISIAGWYLTQHSHQVDNTESGFKLKAGTTEIATVRPWWGWLIEYSEALATKLGLANCHSQLAVYWEASLSGNDIYVKRANYGNPRGGWDNVLQVTSTADCSDIGIDFCSGLLTLVYTRGGNVCIRVSNDRGESFRSETVIMAGGILNRIHSSPLGDRILATFKYDSGTSGAGKIYVSKKLRGDTSWSSPTAILNSSGAALSVADNGFDFSYGHANGRWILSAVKYGGTDPTTFASFDKMTSVVEC